MLKIIKYLNLNKIGYLEIILALYPLMAAYRYGPLFISHIVLLSLDVVLLLRGKSKFLHFVPLLLFLFYYVFHQIVGVTVFGLTQSYYINTTISSLVFLVSLFIIVPNINFDKFEGSINWVSIFCLIGLFYHAAIIIGGGTVTPIRIPFLPEPEGQQSRLFDEMYRPSSFFMEPQSYVSYMLLTLFFAIRNQKYLWVSIVGASMILSTSTTGLAVLPIIIFFSITRNNRSKWYSRFVLVLILVGLTYFLFNSSWNSFGLNKMENTSLSTNSRTSNGPIMAGMLDFSEYIIGAPYANATDLYKDSFNSNKVALIVDGNGGVFISGFWECLIFYGIVGLLIYLSIYWRIWKENKEITPLIVCLIVMLFTNPDYIGAWWSFQMMYLLTFVTKKSKVYSNKTVNVLHA